MTKLCIPRHAAKHLAILAASLIVVSSCSGGGDGATDTVQVGGDWQGTWESSNPGPSGTLEFHLDEQGTTVTGEGRFGGHACIVEFDVSCKTKGGWISGWFEAGPHRIAIEGSCKGSHYGTLTGTYEIHDGPCGGEHGTIEMTRLTGGGHGAPEPGGIYVGDVILIGEDEEEILRASLIERAEHRP